ncbi:hypothetical protein Leryth_026784 [Lithospermum erythrorhizon]|nr:hypothetical protein Leryth_026784 [Lithospermum erythrorhizon]
MINSRCNRIQTMDRWKTLIKSMLHKNPEHRPTVKFGKEDIVLVTEISFLSFVELLMRGAITGAIPTPLVSSRNQIDNPGWALMRVIERDLIDPAKVVG